MQVRVQTSDGSWIDVTVHVADGATVGDLAAAIAAAGATSVPAVRDLPGAASFPVAGATIDAVWWPADARLDHVALAPGSSVALTALPPPPPRPGDRAPAAAVPVPLSLTAVAGPDAGHRIALPPGETVLGRTTAAAVDDPTLSRSHLCISVDSRGSAVIGDVGSTNGTLVEGIPVTARRSVPIGAHVRAGATTFRVDRGSARTPSPAGPLTPHHRPPRPAAPIAPSPLVAPVTPAEPERPRLGVATLAVPLATGAVLTMIYGPRLAVLVIIGPLIALIGWLVARHAATRNARRAAREHQHALEELRAAARSASNAEAARLRHSFPTLLEVLERVHALDPRIWERRPHHDDQLRLVVGHGQLGWTCRTTTTPDPAAASTLASIGPLTNVPITVDATGLVGIVGPRAFVVAVARSLSVQAAAHHGPADLRIRVLSTAAAASDWLWARWLPHTTDPHDPERRSVSTDAAAANEHVARTERTDGGPLDWWIIDGDDERLVRVGAIRAMLAERDTTLAGLVLASRTQDLPASCTTVVTLDTAGVATVDELDSNQPALTAAFSGCSVPTAEAAALHLARRRDPELTAAGADLPDRCALLPLLGNDGDLDETVRRRWQRSNGTDELVVPIGTDEHGPVEVDLVRDGPHALVAGTTGSGKSELLRSLVAAIAATADTDHVNMVLVDFKGGAAFDRLTALPHVVGSVTDLDERLAARALSCLNAELRRREHQLRDAGASDITGYVRLRRTAPALAPLPRLVVVVDEFATLVAELPDFVDSLVDLAQRGRSLGVHLVLATQRPAGAVKDSIRTNTNLRIALRVVEPADSRDVIGSDAAARLPLHRPGRATMRSGASAVATFQTAQISGHRIDAAGEPVRATRWTLAGPPIEGLPSPSALSTALSTAVHVGDDDTADDLDSLLHAITAAHAECSLEPPRRPWPDPLPDCVEMPNLGRPSAFALLDEPEEQRQVAVDWEPSSNLVVAGLPGSGVTTTVAALGMALAAVEPDTRHFYVVTTDPNALAPLAQLPHCGAVIAADDLERVVQLLRRLDRELRTRRRDHDGGSPGIVTFFDGITSLRTELEDRGLLDDLDLVERLAAEGPALGLSFVFAGEHPGAIGHRIDRTAQQRLLLRLPERADYIQAGLHAVDPQSLPPGRGFLGAGEVQVARPNLDAIAGIARAHVNQTRIGRARPWSVAALPRHVDARADGMSIGILVDEDTTFVPIGVSGNDGSLGQVGLTFRPGDHALVAGPARSGKSTVLATLEQHLRQSATASVVRLGGRQVPRLTGADARDQIVEALASGVQTFALIDDADMLDDTGGALLALLQASDPMLHVIAAGRNDRLRSLFRHWTTEVRRSRNGLLLRGEEADGDLLSVPVPRRSPAPWVAGRGWLVGEDSVALCQVATFAAGGTAPTGTAPTGTDPTGTELKQPGAADRRASHNMEEEECA